MEISVLQAQAPLRQLYKHSPSLALVVDHATTGGVDPNDPLHTRVEPMDGCGVVVPIGVHRALGGTHDAPTPGDLLCAALAACQDSSIRMIANLMEIELTTLQVKVKASVDVRGALAMDKTVPVGFQSMTCEVFLQVKAGTPAELIERLKTSALRCCVVRQTLCNPPPVQTSFRNTDVQCATAEP